VTSNAGDRHIEVTVQRTGGLLHGQARDLGGQTREFTGLLGLFSALDVLLADPQTATTTEET
jgi:hypothetical protein